MFIFMGSVAYRTQGIMDLQKCSQAFPFGAILINYKLVHMKVQPSNRNQTCDADPLNMSPHQ